MSSVDLGIQGVDFLEYAGEDAAYLSSLFREMGMEKVCRHKQKKITLYKQHDIHFLLNEEPDSYAKKFSEIHGPCVASMAWRVDDARGAQAHAVKKGAKVYSGPDQGLSGEGELPAVYGVGDSLIYFVDTYGEKNIFTSPAYEKIEEGGTKPKGLLRIDHLTNNVPKGEMDRWRDFYADIFGFEEIRYFDIKGSQTGLLSRAMGLPNRSVIIPINEPVGDKSQIQEYLDEYRGPGIQHIALSTADICDSVGSMVKEGISFLDIPNAYYDTVKERVPDLEEDLEDLKRWRLLADGDEEGYLLQIFTKNVIGPIFYEIIQRKNHWGFGEGNFQALFDAVEKEQKDRGYL